MDERRTSQGFFEGVMGKALDYFGAKSEQEVFSKIDELSADLGSRAREVARGRAEKFVGSMPREGQTAEDREEEIELQAKKELLQFIDDAERRAKDLGGDFEAAALELLEGSEIDTAAA
ncbi:MAG: hypothetical protein ABIA47_02935 [bacterium]